VHTAPDIVVNIVGQVRQGDPQRPVRRLKASAVQQDDAVGFGQPEGEIERMNVLLQIIDRIVADVLARPELEVDEAVIGIKIGIGRT
jgi:hypothetical protein